MQKATIFIIMILFFACSKENKSNYELLDGCYVINFYNVKSGTTTYTDYGLLAVKRNNQLFPAFTGPRVCIPTGIDIKDAFCDSITVNNNDVYCSNFKHYVLKEGLHSEYAIFDSIITDTSFYHIKSMYWDGDGLLNGTYEGYYYYDSLKPKVTGNFKFNKQNW